MVEEFMVKRKKKHCTLVVAGSISFSIILLFIALIYVWLNLGKYSVYYAQHLPHKIGTNPVLVAVFNNYDSLYIPKFNFDTNSAPFGQYEIFYHMSTLHGRWISVSDRENKELEYTLGNGQDSMYSLDVLKPKQGKPDTYNFLGNGILSSVIYYDSPNSKGRIEHSDKEDIEDSDKILSTMYGNIVSHRQVPKINLQWLYNLLNERKFN